jgi:hypothetical protein
MERPVKSACCSSSSSVWNAAAVAVEATVATVDHSDIRGSTPHNHDPSGAASDYRRGSSLGACHIESLEGSPFRGSLDRDRCYIPELRSRRSTLPPTARRGPWLLRPPRSPRQTLPVREPPRSPPAGSICLLPSAFGIARAAGAGPSRRSPSPDHRGAPGVSAGGQ